MMATNPLISAELDQRNPFFAPGMSDDGDAGTPTRPAQDNPFFAPGMTERVGWWDAFGRGAADAATVGFGDEIAGAVSGVQAMSRGEDYGSAYARRVADARARLAQARADRPWATGIGAAAGAGATFMVPGVGAGLRAAAGLKFIPRVGAALETAAAGHGARALGAQVVRGAGAGTLFGGAYGFGAADADLGERAAQAGWGAAIGAGAGAVSVPVFQLGGKIVSPITRPLGRAWQNYRDQVTQSVIRGQTNALIGPPIMGGPGRPPPTAGPATPEPPVPGSVVDDIDRMLGREKVSATQFGQWVTAAQAEADAARAAGAPPLGRTVADLGGDQFQAKTRMLAQAPGETGPMARNLAEERARALPQQITDELQSRLGVSQSPTQAMRSLQNAYAEASRENYRPLFSGQTTVEQAALYQERIVPLMDDPIVQDAVERAERIFAREARLEGRQPGNIQDSLAQFLHYVKMGLDDAVSAAMRRADDGGIAASEARGVLQLKKAFVNALDPGDGSPAIIPGYAAARARWGGIAEAEQALEEGAKLLRLRPEEIRARVAEMTPFELEHAQIAAADEVVRKVMSAASAVGNRNAANALNSLETQGRLRAIFNDDQAADLFIGALNERNQLMRNASNWTGGSSSFANFSQAGDQFLADAVEAGLNPAGAGRSILRGAANIFASGMNEARNNRLGNVLLSSVEDASPEARAFMRALLRRLQEREQQRMNRATGAAIGGAQGSIGGGGLYDQSSY